MMLNIFKSGNRGISIALILTAFVFMIGFSWFYKIEQANATPSRPSINDLVNFFDTVVFGNEMEPDKRSRILARWVDPIVYEITGNPTFQQIEILENHIQRIKKIINIPLQTIEILSDISKEQSNMTFIFIPGDQMSSLTFENVNPDYISKSAAQRTCYFVFAKNPPDQIVRSFIVLNSDREIDGLRHCLLEELVQSLGLPNDTNMIRPSLFSDSDQLTWLARHDEIILRTLYDSRLQEGMGREQSLKLARDIISDWDNRLP